VQVVGNKIGTNGAGTADISSGGGISSTRYVVIGGTSGTTTGRALQRGLQPDLRGGGRLYPARSGAGELHRDRRHRADRARNAGEV